MMTRRIRFGLLLSIALSLQALLLGAGEGPAQETSGAAQAKGSDASLLQGKWEVEAIERDPKQQVQEASKATLSMIFFGDRVKMMQADKVTNDAFLAVDTAKKPWTIDIIDKWDRDKVMRGIFEVTVDKSRGDTLRLCLARQTSYPQSARGKDEGGLPESSRPTEFVAGAGQAVIRLRRVHLEPSDLFGYRDDKRYLDPENDWLRLRKIARLLQSYEAEKKTFPPAAICDKKGEPLLSWRVALLPYMNQKALYDEFKLDEPWNSDHNKRLIAKMPDLYMVPASKTARLGETHYRVLGGGGAAFDLTKGTKASEISDGLDTTLAVVQAAEPVPWTQPEVLTYDANAASLPRFAVFHGEGTILAAFFDGHVLLLDTRHVTQKTLRALITRAGGEKGPFELGPMDP